MFEKIEIIRRLMGTLVVAIGSLGCFWRDIHGPPTVLGILLAGIMIILEVANRERALLRSQLTKETNQAMQPTAR